MTNEEAYAKLLVRGVSKQGALRILTYAYHAQIVGSWERLFVNDGSSYMGGSEGSKDQAMDIFRDAGINPMSISFPEKLVGKPPFAMN